MTQAITYAGVALTTVGRDSVRLVEAAHTGDVGMGLMTIDDVAGALTPVGFQAVVVSQDAAPSNNQHILTGRSAARRFRRGTLAQIGAGREIEVDLLDDNVLLGDHVVWDTDGNRPSETISARLTWLLASTYVAFHDNGNVVYSTKTMDANDYRGQTPGDVIFDCANIAGYNYFIYYDESAAQASLFFDNSNTSTNYSTTTKISNVAADVDGTTVLAPLQDAELTRDPSKVASGVLVPYAKGSTYRTLPSTGTVFTPRDMVATTANIKTLASAQALGDRLLGDNDEEDDSITCSVWVLPANVNDIRAGHLMQVKFSHLPGYEAYSYVRVTKRTVSQPQNTDFRYQLDLELSPAHPLSPTASYAEVVYPEAPAPDFTAGPALLNWGNTGDSPRSPRVAHPLTGLMAYDATGVSGSFPSDKTGIKMLGGGTVTIHCEAGFEFAYTSGSGKDVTLTVYKNGVSIGSAVKVDSGSNIHTVSGYLDVDLTGVTVVTNDIITAKLSWITTIVIGSIPIAGTNGTTYMSVTGNLT